LPIAVAIKANANPQRTSDDVVLFGEAASKRGYLGAVVRQENEGFLTTIGIDFKILDLPSGKYKIRDLAGQERFRTMTPAYIRNANIVLLFSPDNNLLSQLRTLGFEIHQIDYDLGASEAALIRNENPFENVRAQPRVPAAQAREITENLLPQVSLQLRAPAAAPLPARPQSQGFFDKISGLFGRDDKDEKKEPPRPQ
jgi:GTPase SAR1 family protein